MFIFDTIYENIFGVLIALLAILVAYYKWTYQYWRRKNVPYLEPTIPFGTINFLSQKENSGIRMKHIYDEMKSRGWKHGGIYTIFTPYYFVVDLEYAKNIMTKDFEYFTDRGFYYSEKNDPLSANMFNVYRRPKMEKFEN